MTKGITIALCASTFIASMAPGQMKYSRSRSLVSPTPTPSPTPQTTASPAANFRRSAPPPYYSLQPKPTASVPLIPAQRTGNVPGQTKQNTTSTQKPGSAPSQPQYYAQPKPTGSPQLIPAQRGSVPVQTRQTTTSTQRTGSAPLQPQPTPAAGQRVMAGPNQPRMVPSPAPVIQQPTPPPVPPPDIQAYLSRQLKDGKFHLNANGKDLPLTPFHVWRQREVAPGSTATCVDMRSDEGRVYDIDFVTTGKDVTSVRVHRINGETVR